MVVKMIQQLELGSVDEDENTQLSAADEEIIAQFLERHTKTTEEDPK